MAVDLVFTASSLIFDIFLLESILFLEKLETSEVFPFTERASGKAWKPESGIRNPESGIGTGMGTGTGNGTETVM